MQVVQLIELISLKILLFCSLLGVRMAPTYFPLRWESTGDQWWYASPIDWAAANGHFDLVRELLRIDNNHLIKLTSLRRVRRLETVWDDEEQFDDVAKCRSQVARKLFHECESKKSRNSLIRSGYGGWLMYTAASAGDLSFIQLLLDRNPLLVFGEGEYGVTDILYAAARSKNSEVFRIVYDYSVSPRFLTAKGGEFEEHIGDIPSVYKWEMINRAVHAAARGGNLTILQELLRNCTDVLAYRDKEGSTVLHAAAAKGQVEIVKDLIAAFDIIKSTDHQGNTALHIAAYRGQSSVVEALIEASPSLVSSMNNAGETFLHMAVSGLQTPAFKRLDRHIELMKRLISGKKFNMEEIINAKNNDGRTALHAAIVGNVHSDLVQLLMSARSINVNARDADGLTPLDLLKQGPYSPSSDILIRRLISAGAIFGCQDYTARRAIASRLKMQGGGISPGTLFRISDAEIFLYTGVEIASDANADPVGEGMSSSSTEYLDSTNENQSSRTHKKSGSMNNAAQQLKKALLWPRMKGNKPEMFRKSVDQGSVESSYSKCNSSEETPTPLRLRFVKPLNLPNNKRTLAVRSNQSSPKAKKKFASGIMHGVMQAIPRRSRSSSFSKSSISSPTSMEKQKGNLVDNDIAGPSSLNQTFDNGTSDVIEKASSASSMNKRLRNQYFCFGGSSLSVKTPVSRPRQSHSSTPSVISVA
ncbi:Ankyrin repeat family protein [Euphorbia peplus]|nr:Ankyrin repeat family protein [Euphorbia peplus]